MISPMPERVWKYSQSRANHPGQNTRIYLIQLDDGT